MNKRPYHQVAVLLYFFLDTIALHHSVCPETIPSKHQNAIATVLTVHGCPLPLYWYVAATVLYSTLLYLRFTKKNIVPTKY